MDKQLNMSPPCDALAKGVNMTLGCINGNIEWLGKCISSIPDINETKIVQFSCQHLKIMLKN